MPVLETFGKRQGDVIRYEEPISAYSRDIATAGANIAMGQLLTVTAGTAAVTAATGTPNAVAIMDAASGEKVTILARHAIVNINGVIYPAGATDAQKTTMNDGLKAVGILARP